MTLRGRADLALAAVIVLVLPGGARRTTTW
jgi:hypothetical protein